MVMDDFDRIETPENVELEQRLAGIGSRFIAGLVDVLVMVAVLAILAVILMLVGLFDIFDTVEAAENFQAWTITVSIILMFLVFWGYFVFFEVRTNGQTPGKKSLKIRVVKEGGGGIIFVDAAIRNLLRVVDFLPFGYAVGGISMFFTRKTQRLGDLAAGTVVVSEQMSDYSARSDKPTKIAWEREVSPEALRTTGLKPEEYRALQNYQLRRAELSLDARKNILPKLLTPIMERLGKPIPEDPSLVVLERYVDELLGRPEGPLQ